MSEKKICQILVGDIKIEEQIGYGLPYLSGSDLVEISQNIGIDISDIAGDTRWWVMQNMITRSFAKDKLDYLLSYLVNSIPFEQYTLELPIKEKITRIKTVVVDYLNQILIPKGHILKFVGSNVSVFSTHDDSQVESNLDALNSFEVNKQLEKCQDRLDSDDIDAALVNARTILESVMIAILEKHGIAFKKDGKIMNYWETVKNTLDFQKDDVPAPIQDLITGFNITIGAIGKIRNDYSDAHAKGQDRIELSRAEVILCINSVKTISNYLIDIENSNSINKRYSRRIM